MKRVRQAAVLFGGIVLLVSVRLMHAQNPGPILPHGGLPAAVDASPAQYRQHLQASRVLVEACARSADACDASRVGDDNRVHPATGEVYVQRFGWLRDLLDDRNDPQHTHRAELLPHALQRLNEQEAEIDGVIPQSSPVDMARAKRRAILARREFRSTRDYSLTEKIAAWIGNLLDRFFGGFATLGRAAPWLGKALQWGTLCLAGVLLLLWMFRALDRSRVALGRLSNDADRRAAEQQAESRAWAERARASAERGEWRDAVHALYWASIVALEDRRTLRRSTTRTPREALRLIDPASHLREPLRAQTVAFEQIWYGNRTAAEVDYDAALTHFKLLQASNRSAA